MKYIFQKPYYFFVLALVLTFSACKKSRYEVDTDTIQLEMDYRRLDRDVFPAEKASADQILQNVKTKYPDFYFEYFMGVLSLGDPDKPEFNVPLAGFTNDVYIKQLADEVNIVYSRTDDIEKDITAAFKRYHHFLPDAAVPKVVFCISGLNYAVVATDSVLAIGLDMFLGENFEPYKAMGFPDYLCYRKNKKHLVTEVLQGWLISEFPMDMKKTSMVDYMVYKGKIMFLLNVMLPDYSDERLFGFKPEAVDFIEENEAQIWAYFIENKLLFIEDKREIMKYMEEAPFAAGMPREVPGRIGLWIGRNMVKNYMDENPEITFTQLMADSDYKSIFTKSKYKPKYK